MRLVVEGEPWKHNGDTASLVLSSRLVANGELLKHNGGDVVVVVVVVVVEF